MREPVSLGLPWGEHPVVDTEDGSENVTVTESVIVIVIVIVTATGNGRTGMGGLEEEETTGWAVGVAVEYPWASGGEESDYQTRLLLPDEEEEEEADTETPQSTVADKDIVIRPAKTRHGLGPNPEIAGGRMLECDLCWFNTKVSNGF